MQGSFCPKRKQKPEDFIASVKKLLGMLGINLTVQCYKSSSHHAIEESDVEIKEKYAKANEYKNKKSTAKIPGVYVFLLDDDSCDRCLKVGKVGNIAESRWHDQHYNGQAISSLPGSIVKRYSLLWNRLTKEEKGEKQTQELLLSIENYKKNEKEAKKIEDILKKTKQDAGQWVKTNTCRLEFIFEPEERDKPTHAENFLEGYLHWLLKPCYEGVIYDSNDSFVSTGTNEGDENQ